MSDYIPGWSVVFPEPHERDEPAFRPTGRRREPPTVCYMCGEETDTPLDGQFCSTRCMAEWVRR